MKKISIVLLTVSMSCLISCEKDPTEISKSGNFTIADPVPGKWRQMLDTNNIEIIEPVFFSIGSNGFAINQQTNEVYKYDAVANKVIKMNNFPGPRRLSSSTAFSIGDKGYYGLGLGQRSLKEGSQTEWEYVYRVDFWQYDAAADNWIRKADLPIPRQSFFGAFGIEIGSKGYVGSGRDNNFSIRKYLYEYNPLTNEWIDKTGNYAPEYSQIAMAFSTGTKGYIADSTNLWEYTPSSSNPWKRLGNVPATVRQPAIALGTASKGYIYGSIFSLNNVNPILKNDFWEFTPPTTSNPNGAWNKLTEFGGKPRAASPAFVLNNKIYIGFGSDLSASVLTDMWEYTP